MNVKMIAFYIVVAPIALVWDGFCTVIDYIHRGVMHLDKIGGEFIEKLQDKCRD